MQGLMLLGEEDDFELRVTLLEFRALALEKRGDRDEEMLEVRTELLSLTSAEGGGGRDGVTTNGGGTSMSRIENLPGLPPTRDRMRFGRMVHPRTWSA
jgi:hypothetical protein